MLITDRKNKVFLVDNLGDYWFTIKRVNVYNGWNSNYNFVDITLTNGFAIDLSFNGSGDLVLKISYCNLPCNEVTITSKNKVIHVDSINLHESFNFIMSMLSDLIEIEICPRGGRNFKINVNYYDGLFRIELIN